MRILLVTGSYPPMKCGVGAYTKVLATALSACEKVDIVVITDIRASDFIPQVNLKVLPIISSWRLLNIFLIAKYIMKVNPDVVHFQYPTQGYNGRSAIFLPMLLRFLRVPCVQTWHEPMIGRTPLLLALGLNVLVSVRKELIPSLSKFLQKISRKKKLQYIPAASLLPTFRLNDEARSKIRNQYLCGDELLLTFYGFVAPLKGIEILFEIVAKTNSLLLIASDFNRGDEYHKSLLDMIRDLGIESRVKIMGFMPDDELARILAVSDAAVFPFRDGAAVWNTSIGGAAAQGVFILTTSLSVNGYSESRNIYYAMPGDSREMITALHKYAGRHVLYNEPKLAWKKIAEQHVKIYSELL